MKEKLKQAVMHVNRMRQDRAAMYQQSVGIDQKRSRAYCEYGFPEQVDFDMLYRAYDRNAIGFAGVEVNSAHAWSDHPWVIEGDESQESTKETAVEVSLRKMAKKTRLWHKFKIADTMRLVGGYSYMIIRLRDGLEFDEPSKASSLEAIEEFVPAWANQVKPIYTDSGELSHYQYSEPIIDSSATTLRKIHPSRVIVIGDPRYDRPLLKAGFNELVSLEKVSGGAGESFIKNASRQLHIDFDTEVDLNDIAKMYGVPLNDLHEALNDTAADVGSGVDLIMATQGGKVTPMTVAPADPRPAFEVNTQAFAATIQTPVKILIGNVTGERASSEDWKQFNKTVQSRRTNQINHDIEKLIDWAQERGMIKVGEYSVMWNDLTDGTALEKAETASLVATVLQAYAASENAGFLVGSQPVLGRSEMRTLLGYENEARSDQDED